MSDFEALSRALLCMGQKVTPRKQNELSLEDKVHLLQVLEAPGVNQRQVANAFNVSKSSVSRIVKRKSEILADYASSSNPARKRKRAGKEEDVGKALLRWLELKVSQGEKVNGSMMKAKAVEMAKEKGVDFQPSDGWLRRLKERHNVVVRKDQGERLVADPVDPDDWLKVAWPKIRDRYSPGDIFTMDEFGLILKAYPDRGFGVKEEKVEKSNEWITVVLCSNMTGEEKRPPLVIGRTQHPRCFPHNHDKLPVEYTSSQNSWITKPICKQWITSWDRELRSERRKIVLIWDNSSAHPKAETVDYLLNINIVCLPSNVFTPMNSGIVKNFKAHYRSKFNRILSGKLDVDVAKSVDAALKEINLLNVSHIINDAWDSVSRETIVNGFSRGGFKHMACLDVQEVNPLNDVDLGELNEDELLELVAVDDGLEVSGEFIPSTSLASHDEQDILDEDMPTITMKQKMDMLDSLRNFVQLSGMQNPSFKEIEEEILDQASLFKKQTSIISFLAQKTDFAQEPYVT